ncbi:MAG TPA: hypothetical protein VH063_14665 [Gaiellaceae bacterium]|jgi:uncharacterized membrane protein|nr:hypothetical protein [Gaiellaceae bacterium]
MTLGPVQILVVGFDDPQFSGKVLDELERLKENDVIRLIDLLVVRKDENGELERFHTSDLSAGELEEFGATLGALIGLGVGGDEETMTAGAVLGADAVPGALASDERGQWYVDDAIPNGTAAAVALIEHRWAIGLRESIRDANGFHLADAWIHPQDLIAVGLLAAEEADAQEPA